MRTGFSFWLLFFSFSHFSNSYAQLTDGFDGPWFSKGLTWQGDTAHFRFLEGRLWLNAPEAGKSQLALKAPIADSMILQMCLSLDFSPSASNGIRLYFGSENPFPSLSTHAFFLKIGSSGSDDRFELYELNGKLIARGIQVHNGDVELQLQLSRENSGRWKLWSRSTSSDPWSIEFEAMSNTPLNGDYFILEPFYTASRTNRFSFDNFTITPIYSDNEPPKLLSEVCPNHNWIRLEFNETLDSTKLNRSDLRVNGKSLTDYTYHHPFLDLFTSDTIVRGRKYRVQIDSLSDSHDNSISFDSLMTFYPLVRNTVIINEFLADPTPAQKLPEHEYLELYNPTEKVINLKDWVLSDATRSLILPDYRLQSNAYVVISSELNGFDTSGREFLQLALPSINNGEEQLQLHSPFGILIDSFHFIANKYGDMGPFARSMERINPRNPCTNHANWQYADETVGGSPGYVNSVLDSSRDLQPPKVLEIKSVTPNLIELVFSEGMSFGSLTSRHVELIGHPAEPKLSSHGFPHEAWRINIDSPLIPNVYYDLRLIGLRDCAANRMDSLVPRAIVYFDPGPIQSGQLLITEVFPAPSEGAPFLKSEFIELTNRGEQPLSLLNCLLYDNRDTVRLPDIILESDSTVILCPASNRHHFARHLDVVPLSGFPNLNNRDDFLVLETPFHKRIHAVRYSENVFGVKLGGKSLQLKNYGCRPEEYWKLAHTANPGKWKEVQLNEKSENSLNSAYFDNEGALRLVFNCALDSQQFSRPFSWEITPMLSAEKPVLRLGLHRQSIHFTWTDFPDSHQVYNIKLMGLKDCLDREIALFESSVAIGSQPEPGDLIINEILFNPFPDEADYVELYNRSTHPLNLSSCYIYNEEGTPYSIRRPHWLAPNDYVCFSPDSFGVKMRYADSGALIYQLELPAMPDKAGHICLKCLSSNGIDSLSYSEDMHFGLFSSFEGISLERISADAQTNSANNWSSASSTYSFGTPARPNSQAEFLFVNQHSEWKLERDYFSPNGDGVADQLLLTYQGDGRNFSYSARVYSLTGRLIKTLVEHAYVGQREFISFEGLNERGELLCEGIYLLLIEQIGYDGKARYVKLAFALLNPG